MSFFRLVKAVLALVFFCIAGLFALFAVILMLLIGVSNGEAAPEAYFLLFALVMVALCCGGVSGWLGQNLDKDKVTILNPEVGG